jgi:hypothetical protein
MNLDAALVRIAMATTIRRRQEVVVVLAFERVETLFRPRSGDVPGTREEATPVVLAASDHQELTERYVPGLVQASGPTQRSPSTTWSGTSWSSRLMIRGYQNLLHSGSVRIGVAHGSGARCE